MAKKVGKLLVCGTVWGVVFFVARTVTALLVCRGMERKEERLINLIDRRIRERDIEEVLRRDRERN